MAEVSDSVGKLLMSPSAADRALVARAIARLGEIPPEACADQQIDVLGKVGRHFLAREDGLPLAAEAVSRLVAVARASARNKDVVMGLMLKSAVASQMDNHLAALEHCAEAREVASEIVWCLGQIRALINAAASLINVGDYCRSAGLLREAVTEIRDCAEAEPILWLALGNLAQCELFAGHYEQGLEAIERARDVAPEPATASAAGNRVIMEYTHLRLLVALGRGSEGGPLVSAMHRYVTRAHSARSRIDLLCARGMLEICAGRGVAGFAYLKKARKMAAAITSTLPDVLAALAASNAAIGDVTAASVARLELEALLLRRQAEARQRAVAFIVNEANGQDDVQMASEYTRRMDLAHVRLLRYGT